MYNAIAKYLGEGGTILEAKGQLKNTLTKLKYYSPPTQRPFHYIESLTL